MNEDINDYVPSILNPRCVKKHDLSLTQNSIVSRCSLSLKKSHIASQRNVLSKVNRSNKENSRNISNLLSESQVKNVTKNVTQTRDLSGNDSLGFSAIEDFQTNKESSLSFGDFEVNENLKVVKRVEKINSNLPKSQVITKNVTTTRDLSGKDNLGLSAIDDFETSKESSLSFGDFEVNENLEVVKVVKKINNEENINQESFISASSATELDKAEIKSEDTLFYKGNNKPLINISFGINNCDSVNVTAKNGAIKQFNITHQDTSTNVDCDVLETSQISTETEVDENMNETSSSPRKRSAVAVSLEIKKQKLSNTDKAENSKVLILNTNAIEKISHVIVQPPNYKFVKRNSYRNFKRCNKSLENGGVTGLKQIPIDRFFRQTHAIVDSKIGSDKRENAEEMSRNSGFTNAVKCERAVRSAKAFRKETTELPKSAKLLLKRDDCSPKRSDIKTNSNAPSPRVASAHSPRKNIESIHFSIPTSRSNKSSFSPRNIPHHKIVAGTHFAVDAFSYGEIPNVKNYFLTHFHSDHYTGLKKSFNKLLFCSKITADLCISRLGVNAKCIRVINIDETLRIDSVEVTAVDANHCPGALMLVFTLPNGKTLLHTGDFRACPTMESYPVFWNRDIHTIYLDTTYCNPRYDFPTQDQSLEMALYILRQKKMALEKAGKKFTSVLIICGTYTIGKEKFFLGMSRRVGCSVWACPEKERVLQTVEGKTTTRDSPDACQLHVVPMRDLTHEKLRSYLDSLRGAFSEVVAFKPSGWENGKNSSVEKDGVTIHGIPYSEHSSFSELIRFVKFLKPKQVVPTVDISGGVKAVQKYFPCPLVYKDEIQCQSKLTDYFSIQSRQQATAVT